MNKNVAGILSAAAVMTMLQAVRRMIVQKTNLLSLSLKTLKKA
ncbi:Uncharacterised protein [Salmonella enterica subsp. arizonae]|uniref:Uncharacterized protein n=1 Tax=Salmonella enterica subsp. arizonae TaxID=59203 RepID=A0A3S4GVC4_SALER|nr:Uncharacterised protein [Salmonella enterica subsp. arizonae]